MAETEQHHQCHGCDYRHDPDGGYCYMFKEKPKQVCLKNTALNGKSSLSNSLQSLITIAALSGGGKQK